MAQSSRTDTCMTAPSVQLSRPYFSNASQEEFSDVLNDTDFRIGCILQPNTGKRDKDERRDKHCDTFEPPRGRLKLNTKVPLISEDDFAALSLQALQGVTSFLYNSDTIIQKQLHINNFVLLGRSASSLSKYQLAFSESFYIRVLLGSAQEAFSTLSTDSGQLALGAALGDLLLLHDTSISMLQEKLHNEERTSPSYLWSSVALHRSVLSQIFRIIAPAELFDAFQQVFSTPFRSSRKDPDEEMNQFALLELLISQYMKGSKWMVGKRTNIGWAVLDGLLVHLEKSRKMTSKTSNTSRYDAGTAGSRSLSNSSYMSNYNESETQEEVLSDSLAKVIVILFLVKRVSLPLLDKLQRRLFCLESDFETAVAVPIQVETHSPQRVSLGLDKFAAYHMSVQKQAARLSNVDILVFSAEKKTTPKSKRGSQKKLRNLNSSIDMSGGRRTMGSRTPSSTDDAAHSRHEKGDGEGEGAILQGTVVPSLLLALERAVNPIRLICHAGDATHTHTQSHTHTHSSSLGSTRSRNETAIYGNRSTGNSTAAGGGAGAGVGRDAAVDMSTVLSLRNESDADKKRASDSAVLSACRDSSAELLIPLNVTDLKGLDLLVATAQARFSVIRGEVLADINAWITPEPVYIDHKALQIRQSNKFRRKGRTSVKGGEEGIRTDDEETLSPRSDAGSCTFSIPDVVSTEASDSRPDALDPVVPHQDPNIVLSDPSSNADPHTHQSVSDAVSGLPGGTAVLIADKMSIPGVVEDQAVVQTGPDIGELPCVGIDDVTVNVEVPDESAEGFSGANRVEEVEVEAGHGVEAGRGVEGCVQVSAEDVEGEEGGAEKGSSSPSSSTYVPPLTSSLCLPPPALTPTPVLSSSQRTDLSSLARLIITPDMRGIDREMRFRETVTCTYSTGLLSLAKANGIVFTPHTPHTGCLSSGQKARQGDEMAKRRSREVEEENALMLLMQPMHALLDGTLLSAVSWQCRVLDQAALFAAISSDSTSFTRDAHGHTHPDNTYLGMGGEGIGSRSRGRERKNMGGLLWHIDCYEEAFLLSSKSDNISSLVAILIETYAQRHPFQHSQSVFSAQRSRYLWGVKRRSAEDCLSDGSPRSGALRSESPRVTFKTTPDRASRCTSGLQPVLHKLDLWTEFSLKAALTKLKDQRPEAMRSLTHVQYSVRPVRADLSGKNSSSASFLGSIPPSSSSDSIFSACGLERLTISYTATWPIDTMITPALMRVTSRTTRRLLELAQLTALVRFVWVDTRGRKNTSALAGRQYGARATASPTPSPYSASAAFDRDSSHALRIVQQTLLPLSDFTADRIKSQQIKFRTHVLDASNHGFLGVACALLRYAEGVAFSIFADEAMEDADEEGAAAAEAEAELNSEGARRNDAKQVCGIVEDDFSVADLVSQVLEACRNVLIMLEMSSIQREEVQRKSAGKSAVSRLFDPDGLAEREHTQEQVQTQLQGKMLSRIKESVTALLQCRSNLFLVAKRVAEEEDQQDALALLMFFNQ